MKIKTYNIFCNEEHNFESTLHKDDILQVSNFLSVVLTDDEINWIIWNFDSYSKEDQYGAWNQIIETMIEDVIIPSRDDPDWMKDDIEEYKEYLINKNANKYNL